MTHESSPAVAGQVERRVRTHAPCKAFHVFSGEPWESSLLVFAPTAARARYMACKCGLWDYGDYTDTRARRAPRWDAYADREWVAEQNEDLPTGAEPFYNDHEF